MAKFKVGDKFHFKPGNGWNPNFTYVVMGYDKSGKVRYKMEGKPDWQTNTYGAMPEDILESANSRCVNSTRPIVQMALNASVSIPHDLWEKLKRTSVAYKVAGDINGGKSIDECIKRWRSSVGSQIPGRANDGAVAVEVLEEMKRRGMNSFAPAGVVGNGVGDDPKTREAYKLCQAALGNLEKAKRYLDATEDDPDYPDEVRYVGRCIQDVKEALVKMS